MLWPSPCHSWGIWGTGRVSDCPKLTLGQTHIPVSEILKSRKCSHQFLPNSFVGKTWHEAMQNSVEPLSHLEWHHLTKEKSMCLISWCCPRLLLRRDTVYMPCYLSIIRNTLNFKRKLVPWVSDKGIWGSRNSNLSIHLPSSAVWAPNHYVLLPETKCL